MNDEISLRELIIAATQRWTLFGMFCLAGGILGWIISYIWPSPHRATTELYVGLNVYQAQTDRNASETAGIHFYNADDYKNWQMANLNSLVYLDEIIDETLSQLLLVDSYWSSFSRRQLRQMLHVYWRNAGKWRLVAEGPDSLRTAQAVSAWQSVVVDRVHLAREAAQETMVLDMQLQEITRFLEQAVSRRAEYEYLQETISIRREFIQYRPMNQPLIASDYWSLWQPIAQMDLGIAWDPIIADFPNPETLTRDYFPWLDRVALAIELDIQAIQAQIDAFREEKQELSNQYSQESRASLGLSANLEVEMITADPPQISEARPASSLILVGTVLGFVAWAAYWLANSNLKVRH